MLAIEIIGKGFLELPLDIEITLNYNFDVFTFEPTEGSWSVPYSVQATAHNLKLLGYANRPTARFSTKSAVRLWHSGVVIAEGTQTIEIANEQIEGVLEFGNGNFWSATANVKLNELPLIEDFTPVASGSELAYLDASNASSYPTYKYACFPIYAPNYPVVDINFPYKYINHYILPGASSENTLIDAQIVAQPYLLYVLEMIFKYYGYSITDNYLADSEFKQLTITCLEGRANTPDDDPNKYWFHFRNLPEVGIQELIIAVEMMLGVRFNFSHEEKTVAIININEVLVSTSYTDITNISSVIENNSFEKEKAYVLQQIIDTTEAYAEANKEPNYDVTGEYYISDFELPQIGVEKVEHKTESTYFAQNSSIQTLFQLNVFDGVASKFYYTKRLSPRTDYIPTAEKAKPALKFVFYRGRIADSRYWVWDGFTNQNPVPGFTYPYATASNLDDQGVQLQNCEHTLYWGGEFGLYKKRWKNYFYWLQHIKRTEERNIDFTAAQIRNLKPYHKFRIDGVDSFVQKMVVSLGLREVKRCKCEIVSC